jgi:aryl-alcohol dehydrogenase-like predicted oxidoreductase
MTKVTAPIASATSLKQLGDLVASAQLKLEPADVKMLETASS